MQLFYIKTSYNWVKINCIQCDPSLWPSGSESDLLPQLHADLSHRTIGPCPSERCADTSPLPYPPLPSLYFSDFYFSMGPSKFYPQISFLGPWNLNFFYSKNFIFTCPSPPLFTTPMRVDSSIGMIWASHTTNIYKFQSCIVHTPENQGAQYGELKSVHHV